MKLKETLGDVADMEERRLNHLRKERDVLLAQLHQSRRSIAIRQTKSGEKEVKKLSVLVDHLQKVKTFFLSNFKLFLETLKNIQILSVYGFMAAVRGAIDLKEKYFLSSYRYGDKVKFEIKLFVLFVLWTKWTKYD